MDPCIIRPEEEGRKEPEWLTVAVVVATPFLFPFSEYLARPFSSPLPSIFPFEYGEEKTQGKNS